MSPTTAATTAGSAAAGADGVPVVETAVDLLERGLGLLGEVEVPALPAAAVGVAVRRLAAVAGRLEGVQAQLVAAAEQVGLPEASGAASTTQWLAGATGRSRSQSSRTARLAAATQEAPEVARAVAAGEVGPDQAATIATALGRGVLDAGDTEALLAEARVLPPEDFSRETRRREARRDQQRMRADELAAHERRELSWWRLADGSLALEGRVAPDVGDAVVTALEALVSPDGAEVPEDLRRTPRQLRADALGELARRVLDGGLAGAVGGVRPHVQVVVPLEAMAGLEDAEAAGVTGVTGLGTLLSAAATKRLLCDATVRRVVVGPDSEPVDVGRATRQWPASIRAAIAAVDGGCRAPGSDLPPDRCIVHHLRWWRDGGETSVANGLLLSDHGHRLVHDEGWTVTMDPTTRICTWVAPDGSTHTTYPRGAAARGAGARRTPSRPIATSEVTGRTSEVNGRPAEPRRPAHPVRPGPAPGRRRREHRTGDPPRLDPPRGQRVDPPPDPPVDPHLQPAIALDLALDV